MIMIMDAAREEWLYDWFHHWWYSMVKFRIQVLPAGTVIDWQFTKLYKL